MVVVSVVVSNYLIIKGKQVFSFGYFEWYVYRFDKCRIYHNIY